MLYSIHAADYCMTRHLLKIAVTGSHRKVAHASENPWIFFHITYIDISSLARLGMCLQHQWVEIELSSRVGVGQFDNLGEHNQPW